MRQNQAQGASFGIAEKAQLFDELTFRANALGYGNLLSAISSLEQSERQKESTSRISSDLETAQPSTKAKGLPSDFTALISRELKPGVDPFERPRGG